VEDGGVRWCDKGREVLVGTEKEAKSVGFKEEKGYVWRK